MRRLIPPPSPFCHVYSLQYKQATIKHFSSKLPFPLTDAQCCKCSSKLRDSYWFFFFDKLPPKAKTMTSKVVVTYKRKRLFSRSNHPLVNLNSDTSSECAKSKNFPKQEGPIAECTLQKNDNRFGVCRAYSKENIGEDAWQSENCISHWCSQCSEKHAVKPKISYSACAEQKKPSVSDDSQKSTLEQECSPKTEVVEIISHSNVVLDESPKERYNIDSSGRTNAEEDIVHTQSKLSIVKLNSEYEDTCNKILTVPQPPDACSGAEPDPKSLESSAGIDRSCQMKGVFTLETSTLEETDKLNKDQYNTLHNNSSIKRKLTSALITFCRRSKRNRADNASKFETLPAASCVVDLNEKDIPEDIDNSSSFSAATPSTSVVVLADNPQHFLHGEAKDLPNAAAQCFRDPHKQMIQQKVCMNVEDSERTDATTQRSSNQDVNCRRMHCDVSGRGNYFPHLDLSVPPHVSHNIDCNVPPYDGLDENQPTETSEVVHDSLGSASKIKEDVSTFPIQLTVNGSPVRAVVDKGKCILNSPPALNNYIQFLPESKSDSMLNLPNNSQKMSLLIPSSLQSSTTIGLSRQLDQMIDGRACFPPSYEWRDFQVQPRESLLSLQLSTSDRTQSYSREKMMLDNILTRARAVRGNRSSFLDKFEYPTTWLEEELDSLWIGVRRHGRGNWDAILGDRKLHFLPWKSSWDLAERWQVEQSQLLCSMPVSQRRYISPPDFSSEHSSNLHMDEIQLSLGHQHPVQKGLSLHFKNNKMNKELQKQVTILGNSQSEGSAIVGDESSSTAALINGSLPHWLRTAAEIPPGPSGLTPLGHHSGIAWFDHTVDCAGASHQPWLTNRYMSTQSRPEPHNGGTVVERGRAEPDECRPAKEDMIVILSDASSEETISDDHSRRS